MKLLGDLVNKELMEQEAQRRTPTLDENQARRLHRFAEGQLSGILGKTQVLDKVSVTDADIAAEYARPGSGDARPSHPGDHGRGGAAGAQPARLGQPDGQCLPPAVRSTGTAGKKGGTLGGSS